MIRALARSAALLLAGALLSAAWPKAPDGTPAAPSSGEPRSAASERAAPPPLRFMPVSTPEHPAGHFERVTVHASSLVGNLEGDSPDRQVSVYLPPSYAREPQRRYPVLYLLHGFTDSDSRWFGLSGGWFVNVPHAVDAANAKGVPEMIVVMPDAFTRYGGSMYSSSAVTGDWETFVTRELVRYVDAHYRTLPQAASRGLAGHSMGGYGTLRLGMKYPGVYSSLYALSPCCLAASLEPNRELMSRAAQVTTPDAFAAADFGTKAALASAAAWSPDPTRPPRFFTLPIEGGAPVPEVIAEWAANAPLAMVRQYVENLRHYEAIGFDAGDRDAAIAETVRRLDEILNGYRLAHSFAIYSGDHVDHIEQRLENEVLPFFGKHLKPQ